MVEPKVPLAARTVRSTSTEVDLTLELTSFDAATRAFCAFWALVAILSVVLAVTVLSERSISVEIALIWLAASADVAVSEFCASRALFRMEAAVSAPTAVNVRSTSIASDLTWLAASDDAFTNVVWTSRAPERIEAAVAVPAAERVRSTSADNDLNWITASPEAVRSASWATTALGRSAVARNQKQRLLRGARAGLNGLACIDHKVGQRAFRILNVGLDPKRQFLGACHEPVAGLPPAALDATRHGFDARTQKVFELRDAHIDIGGDRTDPGLDALMNFLEPRRNGVGQVRTAAIHGFGHTGDALVDGFDRLGGADRQRSGEMAETRVDRLDRLCGPVGQRRGKLGQARVDRVDRLRGAIGQRRRQRAKTAIDGFGYRFRPRIEGLFE